MTALLAGAAAADPAANALPTGAQVNAGQVAISQSGNTLNIQQSTDKAIVNWQSFDIGAKAAVNIQQPGSNSAILNRVQSQNPSQIFGKLTANGQVFLLNSSGVLFGPGAQVDVGGIVAGAMKITDADFLAGKYHFTDGKGVVTNQGTITASDGGLIALLAPEVRNEGIIRARLGTVIMAAGEALTITNSASGLTVVIDKGVFNAMVHNGHLIAAEDGRVFMSARAADALQRAVIRNTGVIEATNARRVGSVIRLDADSVENSGTIDASGTAKGGAVVINAADAVNTGRITANGAIGGTISITASHTIRNEGVIEANGRTGAGGTIALKASVQQPVSGPVKVSSDTLSGDNAAVAGATDIPAGQIVVSGTLTATSLEAGGGTVVINSADTRIAHTTIDVSGETTGGTIEVQAPRLPVPTDTPDPDRSSLVLSNAVLRTDSRRGTGGAIDLTASGLTVTDHTILSAVGALGGGRILVGGDWQGTGTLAQAQRVSVDASSLVDASATGNGDGGTIVVWSNVRDSESLTQVLGTLRATGGSLGGNGGRIETSGHQVDTSTIKIDASAPLGAGGLWLIDPYNYTIDATAASNIAGVLNGGGSVTVTTQSQNATYGGGASGSGDITVSSPITKTGGGTATLTLQADRNITVSSAITSSTGALNITLSAANAASATVGGVNIAANISSNGGNILIGGGAGTSSHGIGYALNHTSTANPAVAVQQNITVQSGGGSITINGKTAASSSSYDGSKAGIYVLSGATITTGGGNLYMSGISTGAAKEFGFAVEGNSGTLTNFTTDVGSGNIFLDAQNTVNSDGALGLVNSGNQARIIFSAPSVAAILFSINGAPQASTFTLKPPCGSAYPNCGTLLVPGSNNSYLYATYQAVNMATHALYVTTNTASKTYDGTTTASGLTLTATGAPGDFSTAALTFTTSAKTAGTYLTLVPGASDPTTFHSNSTGYDYAVAYFYNPYTINQKTLTFSAANKVYDGTLTAALSFSGVVGADNVGFTASGGFADANVGTGKNVSITGITLTGTDAANYALSGTTLSATANITARPVSLTANRAYDGSTSIAASTITLGNVVSGQALTLTGTGSVGTKTAATGKTLSLDTLALGNGSGGLASNYTLTGGTDLANITPVALSISGLSAQNKTYDSTTAATLSGTAGVSGVLGLDSVSVSGAATGTFADKNVGNTKSVTLDISSLVLGGADAANYTIGGLASAVTANITAATLSITGVSVNNKVFDGTTAATLSGSANLSGLLGSDVVTVGGSASATFDDKNVGTGKTVTITGLSLGGADAGNYTLTGGTSTTATANITAAALHVTTSNVSKTYDGTTSASGSLVLADGTQLFGSDSLTGGSYAFSNKNAGTGNKTVNVSGVTVNDGNGGANYTVSYVANTTSTINKAAITAITGITASNKTYDGTTSATLDVSSAAFTDKISGDVLTVASGSGAFADKNAADGKTVSITGLSLGGTDAGNYTLSSTTASTTADISKAAISAITGITASNKTYDGNTSATLNAASAGFTGKIAGDSLTAMGGTGAFADKNAADGKTVSITGLSLGGTDAGNYTLSSTTASTTANITKAAISTVTGITASNKTYDGNTSATLNTASAGFTGKISGDTLTVASGSGAFADKNAADGKTVSITGLSLGGTDAGNYTLSSTTASTTADISKAAISAITGITASNKTYDGNTSATLNTASAGFTGKISGDTLTVVSGTGTFGTKNAATGKTVTITGLILGGTDAGNYTLGSTTASTTADIEAAVLSISGVSIQNKTYDGTTAATLSGSASLNGVIGGDDVSVSGSASAHFADKNAGTGKTVDINGLTLGGADAGNYTLTGSTATATADISKAVISAITGITANNKTYDGTTAASLNSSGAGFTGKIAGDSLTVASASGGFNNKNAGTGKTVSITGLALGGTDAGNYTLSSTTATTTADISKAVISAITGITASNKTYDGTTSATLNNGGAGFAGRIGSDSLSVASATGAFADKNAANGKTVTITGLSLGGTDAGNYTLSSSTTTTTANITKASISAITGIGANNKTYDGTTVATLNTSGAGFTGKIAGDSLTVASGSGTFADKNAASGKAVSITGLSLSGADAGNYVLSKTTAVASADISKATISAITGLSAANKVYDGTTTASIDLTSAGFTGKIAGDSLTVASGNGAFADKNAATGKTVTITGLSLGGSDAGNYVLSATTAAAVADITKATIAAVSGITAANKVYDSTTTASLNTGGAGFSGKVAGDSLTVAAASGAFADKNASTGKTVQVTGIVLGGSDAGNYTLASDAANTTADITRAAISIANVKVQNKVYDGTTSAALSGPVGLNGLVGTDEVGVTGATARFADKNAGTGKLVYIDGLQLTGSDAANYLLTDNSTTAIADISKAVISAITGISAANKTYDGTTAATLNTGNAGFGGIIAGDSLTVASASGTFADKNAGKGKTVTIAGLRLGGADAGNYTLGFDRLAVSADITPKSLSVTGATVSNKTFDNSSTATITGASLVSGGVVSGDAVTLANDTTGTYASTSPGSGIAVTTAMTLTGSDAANYALLQPAGLTGNINATQSAPREPDPPPATPTPVVPATAPSGTPATTTALVVQAEPVVSPNITVAAAPSTPAQSTTPAPAASEPAATYVLTPAAASQTSSSSGSAVQAGGSEGFTAVRSFDPLAVSSSSSFAFTLPGDTFKHSDTNATISLNATTASGAALPEWVQFSAGERRFTGSAPDGVKELKVVVTARDQLGNEVSTTVTLSFASSGRNS